MRICWEGAKIAVHPVSGASAILRGMQMSVTYPNCSEIVPVGAPMPIRRAIGSNVESVRFDGYRSRKVYLLPARGSFPNKCCRGQQGTCTSTQVGHMESSVGTAFVQSNR